MAAADQMKAVQIQAKELVRTRNFITKVCTENSIILDKDLYS